MEHYTGPLDFIGLPGYEMTADEKIRNVKTGRIMKRDKYENTIRFRPTGRKRIGATFAKVRYCADHGIDIDKFRNVWVSQDEDGNIYGIEEHLNMIRHKAFERQHKQYTKDEQLEIIDKAIWELQLRREAIVTGDYSKVTDRVNDLRRPIFSSLFQRWPKLLGTSIEKIWTHILDTTMQIITSGTMPGMPIYPLLFMTARNECINLKHVRKHRTAAQFELENLHNPDDEMPYQYD